MKVSAVSALLVLLMGVMQLLHSSAALPVPHREDLKKLYHDMRSLLKLVTLLRPVNEVPDYEDNLVSLPSLEYSPKDLKTIQTSSTLMELYTGLRTFMIYLDWIQQKQQEDGIHYYDVKKVTNRIKGISGAVLKQMGAAPSETTHPELPELESTWSLYQASAEIQKKLYLFCDWFTRALRVLSHRPQR